MSSLDHYGPWALVTGAANKALVKVLDNIPRGMARNMAGAAMKAATKGGKR